MGLHRPGQHARAGPRDEGCTERWRVDNGKFTNEHETDGYKDALSVIAQMWKSGVVWPDAFSGNSKYLELMLRHGVTMDAPALEQLTERGLRRSLRRARRA